MEKKLNNKRALITGGNAGIGFATAQEFLAQGAEVIITGKDADRVAEAVKALGDKVHGFVADVAQMDQISNLAAQVQALWGNLDILFVNAGVFYPSPVGQISETGFDALMDINFKGAVFTIEALLPLMDSGASIVNLSSINAYSGMSNTSIYAASKAAMNAYTRTAATELAPKGIRINAVNPGPIATGIFGKSGLPQEAIEGFANALQQRIPLKRFGQPEEVAKLVRFVASDEAAFITGAEINIDGGTAVNNIIG